MYPCVQSQRSSARLPRLLGFAGYEEFAVLCRNFETRSPNARCRLHQSHQKLRSDGGEPSCLRLLSLFTTFPVRAEELGAGVGR